MARVINTFSLGSGGGGTTITVVANYSALPTPASATGEFYWASASQGTSWLPGSLGGTYYNSGMYYSNGVSWEFMNVPYQATQSEVNAGTNTDKFVTPKTLNDSIQITSKVSKTDYTPAHSILVQQSGTGSPSALQIGNNTLVGRLSGGGSDIDDLSVSQVKTLLDFTTPTDVQTIADAKVTDAIVDGVTTVAPSQNAVFDALTLKSDKDSTEKILFAKANATFGSHTGSIPEQVLFSVDIPAGEFVAGDFMRLMFDFTKVGTAGIASFRFRAGTTGTTADALIARGTMAATVLDYGWARERFQFLSGDLLQGIESSSTNLTDIFGNTTIKSQTSLNPANAWKLTVTVILGNSADTASCVGYRISKIKGN